MAENLLWPMKLKTPPHLMMDPAAMFGEMPMFGDYGPRKAPLVNKVQFSGNALWRLIDVNVNSFRIGILESVYTSEAAGAMAMPFQSVSARIDEYRCHGWFKQNADPLSNPDRTESEPTLDNPVTIHTRSATVDNGSKALFKMEGNDLEGEGSGKQFSSKGTYSFVCYEAPNQFFSSLKNVFGMMFRDFASGTIMIEIVVTVASPPYEASDGFFIGAKSI